jgi:anhydro-N-acetylmuramic acid kinase
MLSGDYYVGLMSGTSMDGIDAVLVGIDTREIQLLEGISHPWPEPLEKRLRNLVARKSCSLHEYGELDHLCALQFVQATLALLEAADMPASRIRAIGSHGQTLYHQPRLPAPFSMQIGDPSILAENTGISVVADFRRRDIAAGGQGAPLVPAFHQAIFHTPGRNRVILNIGGIANVTILPASGKPVTGFDTGPGNCLMDQWCQRRRGLPYDHAGEWAARGKIHPPLLETLLSDGYFHLPPPRSTGTEYFNQEWLERRLQQHPGLKDSDIQATLMALTASAIGRAIRDWAADTEEVLVCGGGAHNQALMKTLSQTLSPLAIAPTDSVAGGIHPDWVEAAAFAWLAKQTLEGVPGNLPSVTGARHPVVLGGIYPAGCCS